EVIALKGDSYRLNDRTTAEQAWHYQRGTALFSVRTGGPISRSGVDKSTAPHRYTDTWRG
ncbi:MAG: hypothetical protein J2P17_09590, partial [Mycobacterium sp.]|nr:hypothetical protein [Mycobacterium sp.]